MKRKIALIGAAMIYIAVLAGLLWIQYQTISGARSRSAANGAALVLAFPSAVVFILLIRAGSPAGERRARREACGENVRQADSADHAGNVRQAAAREETRQQDAGKKPHGACEEAVLRQNEQSLGERQHDEQISRERRRLQAEAYENEACLQELLRERYMLTARECAVSWLILRGYTNRQIAEELFISELTVKKHASHIYEKTGAFGRKEYTELVRRIREVEQSELL